MTGGKRYGRYVDDFINSHRYIDCNSAVCRNYHEMNIHIIRGLLLDCTSLVKSLFTAETFSFEECMALKQKYDIAGVWFDSSRIEDSRNAPPLSFGCNFSREQMTGIVACANAYHLFCVSTLRIEDMEALFACKEGKMRRLTPDRLISAQDLCSELSERKENIYFCGDGCEIASEQIKLPNIKYVQPFLIYQSAYNTARLAEIVASEGGLIDAEELQPLYLRASSAEREREARQSAQETQKT